MYMTNDMLDEFYEELANDPEFIEYQERKWLEWVQYMEEEFERREQEKTPQIEGSYMTTNHYDLEGRS